MNFEPSNFISSLPYMGRGMLGIFVAIGIIVLSIVLLNKASGRSQKESEAEK